MRAKFELIKSPTAWALAALFLAALILRVARSDLMEFKHDEAVAWIKAFALVSGETFPSTGLVSSKGLENFPLFIYLIAFFQLIFRQPHAVIWPIALLNSAAVFPIHFAVRRLFNSKTALITCLFYVFAPCAIFFSRKIWAQNLMPFWSAAIFSCFTCLLCDGDFRRRSTWTFFFFLFIATCWQIHLSGVFLVATYAGLFLLLRMPVKPLPALCGAGAGLLPALPWIIYQIANGGKGLATAAQQLGANSRFHFKEIANYFLRQVIDEDFHGLLGADYYSFIHALPGYPLLRYLLSGLALFGFIICGLSVWRNRQAPARRQLFYPFLLAFIFLFLIGVSRISLVPSYFIALYPLPFLFAARGVVAPCEWLSARFPRLRVHWLAHVFLALVVGYHLCYVGRFLSLLDKDGGTKGAYGITYAETERAAAWLIEIEGTTNSLMLTELAFFPPLIADDRRLVGTAPVAENQQPDPLGPQILFINRLLHPRLDEHAQRWVIQQTNALYYLKGPFEELTEIQETYPSQFLTPLQASEAARTKRLALELYSTFD